MAAAAGGPVGLAALGGLAAVAAVEYLGASSGAAQRAALDQLGQPSEAARQMVEKLNTEAAGTAEQGDGNSPEPPDSATQT